MKILICLLLLALINTAHGRTDSQIHPTSPLIRAVTDNNYQATLVALQNKADINELRAYDAHTPLMIAASRNYVNVARLLISSGADLNLTTLFNRTALQIAALNNSYEVAVILAAEKKMDVNNKGRQCAMAVAARQGHIKIVKLLMSLKGEQLPSEKCYNGALSMAEYNSHQDIVDLLKK